MRRKGGWRRLSSLARQGHRQRERHGLFRRTDQRKFQDRAGRPAAVLSLGLSGPRLRSPLRRHRRPPAPSAENLLHRHAGSDRRHIGLPCLHHIGRRCRGLHRLLCDLGEPSGGGTAARWRGHDVWRKFGRVQARAFGARALWLLEICSLLFVVGGIFMYLTDPAKRPMALVTTIFFGCCAASIGYMILRTPAGTVAPIAQAITAAACHGCRPHARS